MGTFIDDQGNIHMEADLANPNSHKTEASTWRDIF